MTTTVLDLSTSRIGMPAMGLSLALRAWGLTTSFFAHQRCGYGHKHAQGGHQIALHGRAGVGQPLQAQDEEDRRDQVAGIGQGGGHGLFSPAEHVKHPVGHQIAPHHIDRSQDDGDQTQNGGQPTVPGFGGGQRTHENNAADRIGAAHQGRVQGGRHLGDDLCAHKDGQDEDGDQKHGFHWIASISIGSSPAAARTLGLISSP